MNITTFISFFLSLFEIAVITVGAYNTHGSLSLLLWIVAGLVTVGCAFTLSTPQKK